MDFTITRFGSAASRVALVGKLDLLGAEKPDPPLAAVSGYRTSAALNSHATC